MFQYKYAKQNSTEFFKVTQLDDESTWTQLKMFNKKMLTMKEFLKPLASKALIIRVRKSALLRELYTLPNRSLLKVKQVMENHIRVEKVSVLWNRPLYFYKESQLKRSSKRNHSPSGNSNSRKNKNGPSDGHLVYLERFSTSLNTTITEDS